MHGSLGARTRHAPGEPLRGRVAVVTGGARGLGAALARSLSSAGVCLALLGRREESLRQVAASLPTPNICVESDVTDRAALASAARRVEAELGPASVVVANAGIAVCGPFDQTPAELWQQVVDVNLTGAANTARAFLPQLMSTHGYFLQVASTAAFGSVPMMSAYSASKAGADSFALALRSEVRRNRVQVGIAYVHWTGTDMLSGIDDDPVLTALRRHQPGPARRVHTSDQVARWLTRGIAQRSPHIYAPPWPRWCQPLRPLSPALVASVARRELRASPSGTPFSGAEVLGASERADRHS
ncbi:SDR family oxidoreductase [Streptomyces rubiginosohelvolus]|uniref:SDR family oxidoreductase n=1 Tax=Streptomyces rubiginosohelvolus TaxID=67362 RepID=UPI0036A12420